MKSATLNVTKIATNHNANSKIQISTTIDNIMCATSWTAHYHPHFRMRSCSVYMVAFFVCILMNHTCQVMNNLHAHISFGLWYWSIAWVCIKNWSAASVRSDRWHTRGRDPSDPVLIIGAWKQKCFSPLLKPCKICRILCSIPWHLLRWQLIGSANVSTLMQPMRSLISWLMHTLLSLVNEHLHWNSQGLE